MLATGSAFGQPDDATKNAARELAERAAGAMEREEYAQAADFYERAYALVPAPTLSVRHARALTKLGKWVEALEAYVRTTRTPLDAGTPPAFREAVQQAYDELAELRPRVPKLTLTVRGASGRVSDLKVTLDGKPYAGALLGVASPVNPGRHEIEANTLDGRTTRQEFSVEQAGHARIELELPAPPAGEEPTPPQPAPAAREAVRPERPAAASAPVSSSQRTWAFVSLGAGAAGLGLGVVTGLMATSKHSTAEKECPSGQCVEGTSGAEAVESFRSLRTVSTIGYVVGVVGVGAGVTLWLTAPEPERGARLGAFVAPNRAGVLGKF